MDCPYCGKEAAYMSSYAFYGRDYGTNVYVCYPCDAYVGTHKGSSRPLGTMANAETRAWRKAAHSMFDALWKHKKMSRTTAYHWMAKEMGLPSEKAHIGMMTAEQCMTLIGKVKKKRGLK